VGGGPTEGAPTQTIRATVPLTRASGPLGLGSSVFTSSPVHAPSKGTVYLVAEEIGEFPDEAYAKVVFELGRALESRTSLVTHVTPAVQAGATSRASRGLGRMRAMADRKMWAEIRRTRPETLVYVSRSSATLAALIRSKLLTWMARHSRVVMIALQPRALSQLGRLPARWLWPDLLLVSTDAEVRQARALGATADRIVTGVDLDRFRAPREGEKIQLRKKWGLPLDTSLILHVGHLTSGRNLEALVPLAQEPGWTALMVASSQQDAESGDLERLLRAQGVIVLRGFLPDIDEIYRLADCYVFPTISSDHAIAMPLSVLEALASDLPVASTRFGALQERFGGAEGLCLVDSADDLRAGVAGLLRHRPTTRDLAQAFSWDAVAAHVTATAS
jgi:glycosyltransferase involved in cell wall biosynthesis